MGQVLRSDVLALASASTLKMLNGMLFREISLSCQSLRDVLFCSTNSLLWGKEIIVSKTKKMTALERALNKTGAFDVNF